MVQHFLRERVVVDSDRFEATCKAFYGNYTFAEAFARTHRVVNIGVTSGGGQGGLLLNYLTSPHVLVWSAVAVSCALPGLMKPRRLMAKIPGGGVRPWFSGMHMQDGSVVADLPMRRLSQVRRSMKRSLEGGGGWRVGMNREIL
jgi:TAG lipase/steryl ester hydrolase/phospholipase A2/LPA acyltransferase